MSVYAIGDIQGCYKQFCKLIAKIEFNPDSDHLYLVGDLVNRGPDSLSMIKFVMRHRECVSLVLGNHELHLLAVLDGVKNLRPSDNFQAILTCSDSTQIKHWLCQQPLAIYDPKINCVITHAGIHPSWTLEQCLELASEVELTLKSASRTELLRNMFGNKPSKWSDSLPRWKRTRFIINALTRMRYLKANGKMDFEEVRQPGSQAEGRIPWFEFPGRKPIEATCVFGHWSALGVYQAPGILALDSGCCWGRKLSVAQLDCTPHEIVSVRCKKRKVRASDEPS